MSDLAIRVENLSKQYRIGQRERYKALRDTPTDGASIGRRFTQIDTDWKIMFIRGNLCP